MGENIRYTIGVQARRRDYARRKPELEEGIRHQRRKEKLTSAKFCLEDPKEQERSFGVHKITGINRGMLYTMRRHT